MNTSSSLGTQRGRQTEANTEANAAGGHRRRAGGQDDEEQSRGAVEVDSSRQRDKSRLLHRDVAGSLAAQDEVVRKARALWAADRVQGRLAKAVAMVRDGKQPQDPALLLAALAKYKGVIYDVEGKVAEKRSQKNAEEQRRRDAIEDQRIAEEEKEKMHALAKQSAENSRVNVRIERESKRVQRADDIMATRRAAETQRRTRLVHELVEMEEIREQQHVHLIRNREVDRRQSMNVRQEHEAAELVHLDEHRRRRCVAALETQQARKEASDPQAIKALPGHPALRKGHAKDIAPYVQQQRPLQFQLRRWQHP